MVISSGWVKLHRKILDNELLSSDLSAFVVFTHLVLVVDAQTGIWKTGRFKLAELTLLKPTTAYQALKRLEKAGIVALSSDNKMTTISICNWSAYQAQTDNKMTLNKNKETRRVFTNVNTSRVSNETTTSLYLFYLEKFGQSENRFKLTKERKNKLTLRIKDAGEEMVRAAIQNTANSGFHRGDNQNGWKANLDFIIRSYEQVERLAALHDESSNLNVEEALKTL